MQLGECLEQLRESIAEKKNGDPSASYTALLMQKGTAHIARKCGEEALEVMLAATTETRERCAEESADLLYHLMVLWEHTGVTHDDVAVVLERRMGISGIEEKRGRE
jgi:phosphoribosyl-ATP pyrophosphohydrolase